MSEKTFTADEVMLLVNRGVDMVSDWDRVHLDDRDTDLLNLVVNVIASVVTGDAQSVEAAIEQSYDASPERVADWVNTDYGDNDDEGEDE